LLLMVASSGPAQQYAVDWYTVGGGGGASTGVVYHVSGTIGQPDAGGMSGGPFPLVGGFWGIVATVQTPGSPLLSILNTGTNAGLVSWPSPSAGFFLQQNSDLITTNWTRANLNFADDGTTKSVIVTPASGKRFFRLRYP
jgi:hypothetical protein